jgi:tRNA modification GTPase
MIEPLKSALHTMPSTDDTIAAISTPVGTAGIGIIRISGPAAFSAADRIFKPRKRVRKLQSHRLYLGHIIDPGSGETIDEVLLTCMYAPNSFTRQDVVEINSHSGYLLLSKILRLVVNCGVRQAEPGEFTLRAFLNGRLDLTQAEAVVDLINSRSEKGLKMAAGQLQGALGKEIRRLRAEVLELSAHVETAIDFPDEEAEIMPVERLADRIEKRLIPRMADLIRSGASNRIWIDGVDTVLAGCVNVGKSSILNMLLDEPRAIVTPVPGTTRDIIESVISIDGLPVKLADTAGFREAPDEIEALGIEFSRRRLDEADLVLVVLDRSRGLEDGDIEILDRCRGRNTLIVMNKEDLNPVLDEEAIARRYPDTPRVSISARTGTGLENLKAAILQTVAESGSDSGCSHAVANARHINALERASNALAAAAAASRRGAPMEIIASELSDCIGTLGEITGETTTDDLLETIFSRFCLGK